MGIAGFSSDIFLKPLYYISGFFGLLGVFCCLITHFTLGGALTNAQSIQNSTAQGKSLVALWLGQGFLLLVTLALFHFFELQTSLNQRFHPLPSGTFVTLFHTESMGLGLMPWIFFSILGIGLAFFSAYLERPAILYKDVIGKRNSTFSFVQSMLHDVVMTITIVPFIFMTCIGLVWICETVNLYFGWESLFQRPLKTTFFFSLIIVVFRKTNKQLITWMNDYKVGLGRTLVVYMLGISFLILMMHGFSDWFTFGLEDKIDFENTRSPLVGHLSEQTVQTRFTYLILGWWAVWVPWMSSMVARAAIGVSVFRALVQSLVIPVLVFGFGLPQITETHLVLLENVFHSPLIQIGCIAALLSFMLLAWGKIYNTGDAFRGAMLPIGNLPKGPLTRWMETIAVWIAFFLPGWFVLGWLPAQVLFTVILWFTVIVVFAYILAWALFLYKRTAVAVVAESDS